MRVAIEASLASQPTVVEIDDDDDENERRNDDELTQRIDLTDVVDLRSESTSTSTTTATRKRKSDNNDVEATSTHSSVLAADPDVTGVAPADLSSACADADRLR